MATRVLESLSCLPHSSTSPNPVGLVSPAEAVASALSAHGPAVDPIGVVLTASTSEAYALS